VVYGGVRHARSEGGEGVVGAAQHVAVAPRGGRLPCTYAETLVSLPMHSFGLAGKGFATARSPPAETKRWK
jgi:hypothetical protein